MGLVQKKEEHDVIDGIEIIERSDTPDDLPTPEYDLVAGKSAEDIAAEADGEDEADDAQEQGAAGSSAAPAAGSHFGRHAKKDADDAKDVEPAASSDVPCGPSDTKDGTGAGGTGGGKSKMPLFAAIAVICVIVAAVVGYFIGSGGFTSGAAGIDTATLTDDQLDTTVARYSYNGEDHDVTARELIESQYSLDAVKQDDGTYPTPTADTAIAYVRNQILLGEADARGITVSEDEMTQFAQDTIGMSDFATMAEQYQVSEDQAKEIVRQQATLQKLYDQIVPESTSTVPTAPTEPENGDTSTRSKEYADYIIGLAGDEWDSAAGTWASQDGPYYSALSGTDFTADSASYEQALTAYYTAYQLYAQSSSEATTTWSEFRNGLFANADIDLYGLYQ